MTILTTFLILVKPRWLQQKPKQTQQIDLDLSISSHSLADSVVFERKTK